jgi:hypothetical protein
VSSGVSCWRCRFGKERWGFATVLKRHAVRSNFANFPGTGKREESDDIANTVDLN